MASSRLRAFIPCQYLQGDGWKCDIFHLSNLDEYDLIIFQKCYSDEDIDLAKYLRGMGVKTVLDVCDNDFYNPNNHPHPREKAEGLRRMIESVDLVSVSTSELQKVIEPKESVVIDDAIDFPKSSMLTDFSLWAKNLFDKVRGGPLKIIWYGNNRQEPMDGSTSGIVDLVGVIPSLEKFSREVPLVLTVISSSRILFDKYLGTVSFPVRYYQWNRDTFPFLFRQNDICIIPINVDPFTICKTNNRPALSLLMGVPVIADKIPSYEEFEEFLLFGKWDENLRLYGRDRKLRNYHVCKAKQHIFSKYNRERVIFQWSSLFRKLLD